MMKSTSVALAVVSALMFVPDSAIACGGCFAPPGAVSVVTDHRMVLSLSSAETILWDQLRYAGAPSEFSWILPIRYSSAVRVEVGSDGFIAVADGLTSPYLTEPPCGVPATVWPTGGDGVEVRQEGVVGPFAMSIVSGRDPGAIRAWLSAHGYAVPAELAPLIERYTDLSMDFVALRLRPGEGVDRMTPVRIRLPGYVPSLPLRMIAAGAGDRVGLSLVVLAAGRVEAQNFTNAELTDDDLTWRWSAPSDPVVDLREAFEALDARHGGGAWITESAAATSAAAWRAQAEAIDPRDTPGSPLEDTRLAFANCGARCVATRLRAVLPRAALDRDLMLFERTFQARPRQYRYGREEGTWTDAACDVMAARRADAGVRQDAGRPPVPRQMPQRVDPVPNDLSDASVVEAGVRPEVSPGAACAASPGAARGDLCALAGLAAACVIARARRRAKRIDEIDAAG